MSEIIIGVPGEWQNRSDIVQSVVTRSNGFVFAGQLLLNTGTQRSCTLEIEEHNPDLQRAFEIAGGGLFPDDELAAIGRHRYTLYALGSGGSLDQAREMMHFAVALLDAGGVGVKVESSGVAHTAERWRQLASSPDDFHAYTAFVTLIGGSSHFYSCGMHNFGLPDCKVSTGVPSAEAATLLNRFNFYQLTESPQLRPGNTFSIDAGSPHYSLQHEPDTNHEDDHPFHNPFGLWHLQQPRP